MKRWVIFLLVLFVGISFRLLAQDAHFSQFGQTPQLINPGATGVVDGSFRGILNYRNQWGSFGDAYNTYAASFDMPISKKDDKHAYFGLGANFYKDVAGRSDFGNSVFSLSFSGIVPVAKSHVLSVGLQGGYGQYSANLTNLTWGNQFDGSGFDLERNSNEYFALSSSHYFDVSAGVYYRFKNISSDFFRTDISSFNIGFAGYHLNKPNQSFLDNTESEIPMKLVAQFSGTFDFIASKFSVVPSMFYAVQKPHKEITPGILVKMRFGSETKYSGLFKQGALYVGGHYRIDDAIIPQVYLEFMDYMIGVSYDYNNSDLSRVTGGQGGFEISIKYINRPKALQQAAFKKPSNSGKSGGSSGRNSHSTGK